MCMKNNNYHLAKRLRQEHPNQVVTCWKVYRRGYQDEGCWPENTAPALRPPWMHAPKITEPGTIRSDAGSNRPRHQAKVNRGVHVFTTPRAARQWRVIMWNYHADLPIVAVRCRTADLIGIDPAAHQRVYFRVRLTRRAWRKAIGKGS